MKPEPKRVDPFYLRPEWRELVADIERTRGRRCEDPECRTPGGPWSRIFRDHVVELRDGGAALDPANIVQRCGACHSRKTAAVRGARMRSRPSTQGEGG